MSFVKLLFSVPDSAQTMKDMLDIDDNNTSFSTEAVDAFVGDVFDSAQLSYVKVSTGAVQATATITSTGSATNGETASVCNQTLTAKTSGAVPANGEFNISGTVATQATNIALAINSIVALSGVVTATSSLGVVTITAVQPGVSGNAYQLSESLTNVTAVAFASGSDGHQVAQNFGSAS